MNKQCNKKIIKRVVYIIFLCAFISLLNVNVEAKVKKNKNDVKALKSIISEQRKKGAKVEKNIDNDIYEWSKKTGRLVGIYWSFRDLKGTIDFNRLDGLEELSVSYNSIQKLSISKLTKLKVLECYHNKLETLKLENLTNLKRLECNNNKIRTLNIKKLKKLKVLNCNKNKIKVME